MTDRATDLPGLLADANIRLKRTMAAGSSHKVVCPKCEGGRTRELSLSVQIDDDGQGATWNCKRGSCGWTGGGKVQGAERSPRRVEPERRVVPPPQHAPEVTQNRPDPLYAFFANRKISRETVDFFGLYLGRRWFPAHADLAEGEHPAIVFPYSVGGKIVNRKYRSQKKMFMQEKDALPSLFNIDAVTAMDRVVVVEGEMDVLAMHEAGYPQVVSLPNGAPAPNVVNDEKRYLPLETHAELLEKVERFILAGDMDAPGLALREELARRLGRHRCWLVTWPEGCKDCNDTLMKHGADAVRQAIEDAEPYPIEGLYRVTEDTLLALRRRQKPPTMTTGVGVLNKILKLPSDGRLIVVLGPPNHGKTPFVRHLAVHTMEKHDRRWAVFSPEMRPWERFAASCAEWLVGKRFWPPRGDPSMIDQAEQAMTDEELRNAASWLKRRLVMLVNDAERQPPTIDWLLEMARAAILRDGITDLWVDPWNEMSHQRPPNLREDEYIGQSLQRIIALGNRHGCNCWINVHPVTLRLKPGEKMQPPGPYDIAGGAMFFNKADVMLTVFRPADTPLTQVIVRKAKDYEWGRRGDSTEIAFDVATGRYSTPTG